MFIAYNNNTVKDILSSTKPSEQENMMTAQVLTRQDVDRAWQEQIIATDMFEIAVMRDYPRERIDELREEMAAASSHARAVQEMYAEQYDRRAYDEQGRWHLEPEVA
jgi:hypothetical protein